VFLNFSVGVLNTDTLIMNFSVCIAKNRQKKFITHMAILVSSSAWYHDLTVFHTLEVMRIGDMNKTYLAHIIRTSA
jgi:hypothetical protein